uniref:Uncharacterized protein n=1 Tax=Amphimedon queenslandica TaxID=400682 RepID=A0A1X7VQZ0_AMPQE
MVFTRWAVMVLTWDCLMYSHILLLRYFGPSTVSSTVNNRWLGFNVLYCLVFISFPIYGLVADVKIGRHRAIMIGIVFCFLSMIIAGGGYVVNSFYPSSVILLTTYGIAYVLEVSGYGSFKANIIQYNIDQIIGASSREISALIHWHFVCIPIVFTFFELGRCLIDQKYFLLICFVLAGVAIFFVLVSHSLFKHKLENITLIKNPIRLIVRVLCYARKHKYPENRSALTYWEEEAPSRLDLGKDKYGGPFTEEEVEDIKTVFPGVAISFVLVSHSLFKHKLENITLIKNPIRLIVRVLCYARKHKYPENRSALTYWEEEAPSRLDLGKDKYGGPFTEEEVEDVKTVFRMLPLFIAVFSFAATDEVYHWIFTGTVECESLLLLFHLLVIKVCCFKYIPGILKLITFGQVFAILTLTKASKTFSSKMMFLPQIFFGFTFAILFPATLEFTIAQSPVHMRGVMVGMWSASIGCGYLFNINIKYLFDCPNEYLCTASYYYLTKSGVVFIILIVFVILARRYKYRCHPVICLVFKHKMVFSRWAVMVLTWDCLIYFHILLLRYFVPSTITSTETSTVNNGWIGFPFYGLLTDVKIGRHRAIIIGIVLCFLSMIFVGCGYVVNSFYPSSVILWTTYGIAYVLEVAGYCSFKANIVQYNIDQIVGASSHHETSTSPFASKLLLLPQVFHGFTFALIFPASLEFTIAQSPVNMRGVMVGLWFASIGCGYLFNINIKYLFDCHNEYLCTASYYYLTKSVVVFVILIVFVILARRYKYRVRENEVNVLQIVDDHYQRYMEQEEMYKIQFSK